MTTQNKFAFFANFAEAIKALPEEKQAGAYRAICEYGIYGKLPSDPIYLGLCLMAKASIYKEDGRSNNGGNHNPKGINQHSDLGQSCQNRSNQVNSGQSGQIRSIPLETETETRNGNRKQETEKYGELGYVRLTDEQYTNLKEKYPDLDEAIDVLDTWLGKNSKSAKEARGKNHYAYFKQNSWVWERVGEKRNPVESVSGEQTDGVLVEQGKFFIDDTMPEYHEVCKNLTDDEQERAWKWIMEHFEGKRLTVDFINNVLKRFDTSTQFRQAQGF